MLSQHNAVAPAPKNWGRFEVIHVQLWIRLATVLISVLISLACRLNRPEPPLILAHLPTLTRTPLPTLTPTTAFASAALTAAEAIPTSLPQPPTQAPLPPSPDPIAAVASTPAAVPLIPSQPVEAAEVEPASQATTMAEPAASLSNSASSTEVATSTPELPTTTPPATTPETPSPTAIPTEMPTPTETPLPTETLTATPLPSPTATSLPEGWVFLGVRVAGEEEGNLKLYGEVINNTGAAQTLPNIRGTFYDSGGNEISEGPVVDYLPLELIPQGGQVPFALTVFGLHEAADFDLNMEAEPSEETLHHDFEFLETTSSESDGNYCLRAKLHNLGDELHSYLAIVAVLYDEQGNVINFDDHYEHLTEGLSRQALNFELCVDSLSQIVASYELRAWGL